MARKKASKKTTTQKGAAAQLPKGFTPIESGFSKSWPDESTKIGDAIQGVVTGYRDVSLPKSKGGDTQIMNLELADGSTIGVWKSTVLEPLFEEDHTEYEVWIRFEGHAKAKGKNNPAKLFAMAVAEG